MKSLHFPAQVVEETLDQLGPSATDNDIQDRLNKLMTGIYVSKPRPVAADDGLGGGGGGGGSGCAGHGMSHVIPVGGVVVERAKVVVDPKKLRPIVIDGSNVAMR